jgi:hypothetical protein
MSRIDYQNTFPPALLFDRPCVLASLSASPSESAQGLTATTYYRRPAACADRSPDCYPKESNAHHP